MFDGFAYFFDIVAIFLFDMFRHLENLITALTDADHAGLAKRV